MTPGEFFRPITFVEGGQADACTWVTWPYPIICRRSSVFSENDLFDPCDPYVTFDPNLVMWHKWDGQPVLVTKSGQNRSSHVGDIRLWSVDRRRRRRRRRRKKEIVQKKYTVADCDCVRKKKKKLKQYKILRLRRQDKKKKEEETQAI